MRHLNRSSSFKLIEYKTITQKDLVRKFKRTVTCMRSFSKYLKSYYMEEYAKPYGRPKPKEEFKEIFLSQNLLIMRSIKSQNELPLKVIIANGVFTQITSFCCLENQVE